MKRPLLICCLSLGILACGYSPKAGFSGKQYEPDTAMLAKIYATYREPTLTNRRFKHRDIEPLVLKRKGKGIFRVEELGKSVQRRSLYQLSYGTGSKKIMLWSQMHGNESTATMALFDLFNFLEHQGDEYDNIRNLLRKNTTIYFLPMINPDGAEIFTRRNALDIDLNRDARQTATPEARLLKAAAQKNKPDFGFNLHDQHIYYNVPGTRNPATISFLAPAYNYARDINEVRGRAMQLIVGMNALLQQYIPNGVARYNDAHEPRGFGDNFQKWGASTVLIESGGYPGDPEKQYIRKLNFMIILNALIDIAQGSYDQYNQDDYERIPDNATKLNNLLITNIQSEIDSVSYLVDLAIKQDEITASDSNFYVRGRIDDVGDLKESHGYTELDAKGLNFMKGKLYPQTFRNIAAISSEKAMDLLKSGYIMAKIMKEPANKHYSLPLLISTSDRIHGNSPTLGSQANFFLAREGKPVYAVVNGYLIDLSKTAAPRELKNYIP